MIYILVSIKTNQIKAVCDKNIVFDSKKFYLKKIKKNNHNLRNIECGHRSFYKNGRFEFEETGSRKRKNIQKLKEKAKKGELTNNDIQNLLYNLI